jgi:hypothetical protein
LGVNSILTSIAEGDLFKNARVKAENDGGINSSVHAAIEDVARWS